MSTLSEKIILSDRALGIKASITMAITALSNQLKKEGVKNSTLLSSQENGIINSFAVFTASHYILNMQFKDLGESL